MYRTYIKPFVLDVSRFIFDILFPIKCLSCGREGIFLCDACCGKLIKVENQICIVCKKNSVSGTTHPGCKTPHLPDGLISIYDYHDPVIAKAIIAGKYNFIRQIYATFGELIASEIPPHLLSTNYQLLPIPLAKSRQRWRGFNQAEVLCNALSKKLHMPIANILVRSKATKTQKDLKKEARTKNIESAFALDPNLKSAIINQKIILVDDVITTGSTLLEATKVLRRNGAKEVWCLTIARD